MNPALSQEFHTFGEQEHLLKYATLDKNPYCVYGTLNGHAGTPEKQRKQQHCGTSSNMVVIIYCYYIIGCEDKATTWYYSTQLIEVVNTYLV